MDRFNGSLTGFISTGKNLDKFKEELIYQLLVGRGSFEEPSISIINGLGYTAELYRLVKDFIAKDFRGSSTPSRGCVISTIGVFISSLCDGSRRETRISHVENTSDGLGKKKKTAVIWDYSPTAAMNNIARYHPQLLVWDFINEEMLRQLVIPIRRAIENSKEKQLNHLLFLIKPEQTASLPSLLSPLLSLGHFKKTVSVSWAEIEKMAQQAAAAVQTPPTRSQSTQTPWDVFTPPAPPECSICWEGETDTALVPCGHVCVCYKCAAKIKASGDVCPICRQPIKDILKIYKS